MVSDHRKLYRLLKLISMLSSGKSYAVELLAELLDTSRRSVYRYFHLLEEVGFLIDKNFHGHYFMHTPGPLSSAPFFTLDEVNTLKKLAAVGQKGNPLVDSILRKVFETSEVSASGEVIARARLARFIEQLQEAIELKKQVFLLRYHSGNSNQVSDRLLEPIQLTGEYSFLLAYEPAANDTKLFKLDRISDILVSDKHWKHEAAHRELSRDVFNMLGSVGTEVSMLLSVKAFNLLREEFPAAIDHLAKLEEGRYLFHGLVHGFEGIGRFILGLPGEVTSVKPAALCDYLREKQSLFSTHARP